MRPPKAQTLAAAVAVVMVLTPAAFLVWLRWMNDDHLSGITLQPEVVVAPVVEVEDFGEIRVRVDLDWRAPASLLSPEMAGVVSDVFAEEGTTLFSGNPLFAVDYVARLAVHTDRPFIRPLEPGDRGEDVAMLQQLLTDLGYYNGETDGEYNELLEQAVIALKRGAGAVDPDGSLPLDLMIWMPDETFVIGKLDIAVGQPAPGLGTVLAESLPSLVEAEVSPLEDGWLQGETYELEVNDSVFGLTGTAVADEALRGLASLVESSDTLRIDALARLIRPNSIRTVPATSVITGPTGDLCVLVVGVGGFEAAPVRVLESTVSGQALLIDGPESGLEVVINPAEALVDARCP